VGAATTEPGGAQRGRGYGSRSAVSEGEGAGKRASGLDIELHDVDRGAAGPGR
jgi:hypothetical protein